jgi:DNA-directed RNA polymerase specialized sigma24 family protein
VRLTPDEILEAKIVAVEMKKKADAAEIADLDYALESISQDAWALIIAHKYYFGRNDEEISELLHCDERTVRRHKSRLINKLMVRLYGAAGVGV